ncbi:MAG TPA: hypothetical protein DIW86_11795 [Pseudomonas sp.]|nr:hypothetical protein [Pseudomonas sp.]
MARFGSDKIRGHGIPEAIEAILFGKSRMSPKVAILKPLSSGIVIGSGGPFGAEGPIIMTGGSIGSLLAQFLHLTAAERKTLLVAGACAGMTAIFGTPVAALLLAVGVTTFVLQRETEPAVHEHHEHHGGWLIASPSVLILMILLLAMGVIVGVVDVVSVAFAQHQGQPAAASIVLSVYAIGSCLAGLAFGTLKLKAPLPRQFLLCGVATALTTLPLLLVTNILGLAVAVFISGLFFAPTLIVSMALVERVVPPSRLTEGMTWLITGLSIGVAIGAASSGWMIDHFGAPSGFWVALAAGAVVLGSALLGYRRLG